MYKYILVYVFLYNCYESIVQLFIYFFFFVHFVYLHYNIVLNINFNISFRNVTIFAIGTRLPRFQEICIGIIFFFLMFFMRIMQ